MAKKRNKKKEPKNNMVLKKILILGSVAGAFIAMVGAYQIIKENEIALIPEVEARVQAAQEEVLKKVDDKLQSTNDIQIQLGNKVYGDTIRGLERELREIRREQRSYGNEIPDDLIDDEEDILKDIGEEQALLDEMKEKLKKRIE